MDELIEALQLIRKYGNEKYPTHCEHDKLHVMCDVSAITAEDLARLHELGFHVDEEYEGLYSYRYGSA